VVKNNKKVKSYIKHHCCLLERIVPELIY